MNENINYTQRDIKKKFKKPSMKNLNRKIINDETNKTIYKKIKKNKKEEKKEIKTKRAKSK